MSTHDGAGQVQAGPLAQGNQQGREQQSGNSAIQAFAPPAASQAETLMSTQEAKERAELRTAAKGKAREDHVPSGNRIQELTSPPVKPTLAQPVQPTLPQANNSIAAQLSPMPPATPTASTKTAVHAPTTPAGPNTPGSTNALPVKRGRGRPRKSEPTQPTGPPPPKRPRGRPRKSALPPSPVQPNESSDAESEVVPNVDKGDDSDYQESEDGSSHPVPPNILAQFNAHVAILRTRLDSRGIPEQYSVFKSFWVPARSAYFDGGATAPPGRFIYWDPLFITSVACPDCQQPLAIAAGGGWLDAPLGIRDEEGICWVIGRRYVCTQCFAATEEATSSEPGDVKPKVLKIDFASPVYYLSWEKRFRALLPEALASEFPKRVQKRAAFNRAAMELSMSGDVDVDMEDEGEEGETPKRSRRVRHCMKCGSKACPGRVSRARCPNPCHDCGLASCNGRTKPNITCKGQLGQSFREQSPDESSTAESPASATTPAIPQSLSWPTGLPSVPSGFVLAIPYAVGANGKPTGAQPATAYLVPQGQVPGFSAVPESKAEASSSASASGTEASTLNVPAPALPLAAAPDLAANQAPAPDPAQAARAPARATPQASGKSAQSKSSAQSKAAQKQKTVAPQPAPAVQTQAQAQTTAQAPITAPAPAPAAPAAPAPTTAPAPIAAPVPTVAQVQVPPPTPSHPIPHAHHPQPPHPIVHPPPHALPHHGSPYPPQHGAPYAPPPPPPAGSPDPGFYGGFYPYSYPPPYGYTYYQPYTPPHGPGHNPPGAAPAETNTAPGPPTTPSHPQYAPYPTQVYGGPPPGTAYPLPHNAYAVPPPGPAPGSAPPNGYNAPPLQNIQAPQQPQPHATQYAVYQPPDPNRPVAAAGASGTRKRKAPGPREKSTEGSSTA